MLATPLPEAETQTAFERFRFADWTAEVSSAELVSKAETIRLEPRQMALLALLASRPGQVISRQRLLEEVWKGEFVSDDAVWRCIHGLRKTLGDDSGRPRFIETLPRLGYRFIAEVRPGVEEIAENSVPVLEVVPDADEDEEVPAPEVVATSEVSQAGETAPVSRRLRLTIATAAIVAGLAILALLAGWAIRSREFFSSSPSVPPPGDSIEIQRPQRSLVEQILADAWEFYRRPELADKERAVELFERAVALDPNNPSALVGLGNGYLSRGQFTDRDPKWLNEADALSRRALFLAPKKSEVHRLIAGVAFARGFHAKALASSREAERLDPSAPLLLDQFGTLYLELGRPDDALLAVLRRRERPLPGHVANQAEMLAALGAHAEAQQLLTTALERAPSMPVMVAMLARLRLAQGRRQEAREALDRVLVSNPQAPLALVARAELALVEGKIDEAYQFAGELRQLPAARAFSRDLVIATASIANGRRAEADLVLQNVRATAERLLAAGHEGCEPRMALAAVACASGHREVAMHWLEEGQKHGFLREWWTRVDPTFACVTADPRFTRWLEQADARAAKARARLDRTVPRWRRLALRAD